MNGAEQIAAERKRQVDEEGWTPEHDDQHIGKELAMAASCYAYPPGVSKESKRPPNLWPWDPAWWKPDPDDEVHNLVRAGALIAAEIDRLQRAQ